MKKIAWILAGCFLIALTAVAVYSQEDIRNIDNTVFDNPQRPPTVFNHDEHNEKAGIEDCNLCHHVYVNGELDETDSSEGVYCYECHGPGGESDKDLIEAYHGRCKQCHRELKEGPVMCGECHVK